MHAFKRYMPEETVLQADYAYDGNGNIEYIGFAPPGSRVNEANWMIRKYFYDGSSNLLYVRFADNSLNFDKKWTKREDYEYSRI